KELLRTWNFADKNILKIERRAVGLQFYLSAWIDQLIPIPVILHYHMIHYQLIIQVHRHFLAHHLYAHLIPLTDSMISGRQRLAGMMLIIVQSAGALRVFRNIPNLHLRRPAQIDAAVASGLDLP